MLGDNWIIPEIDKKAEENLSKSLCVYPLTSRILLSRGFSAPDAAKSYLNKSNLTLHSPLLMKDMEKARDRIKRAIKDGEHICIYGDYDVDGVTSTAMLYLYLKSEGASCECFIPERLSEGYGLNKSSIEKIAIAATLIITVDTGITAVDEVAFAAALGVDVIITDHHNCRETPPPAHAIVNPRRPDCPYPFKSLAGVGVVFKLICALMGDTQRAFDEYSDLAALGTVADVMPLTDENRLIVIHGLKLLSRTNRPGLAALMDNAGVPEENGFRKVNSTVVGYTLAPRLNAAGRISSAEKSLRLLLETDYQAADILAKDICEVNKKRQSTEQAIFEEAINQIGAIKGEKYSYILSSDAWHQGVIGVVASRIAERYLLPVLLFSFDGDIGKGSGRSIKGLSLTDMLGECGDLLIEFGGHELAAGLSIHKKNLDEFIKRFESLAAASLAEKTSPPPLEIDCEIFFNEITVENARELSLLEPFGLANASPLFILKNACITEISPISRDRHIRVKIKSPDFKHKQDISGVYFGISHIEFPFCRGDCCDLACTLGVNDYHGYSAPQIFIKDARPREDEKCEIRRSREYYNKICPVSPVYETAAGQNRASIPEFIIPAINDFRAVFRVLKRELSGEKKRVSARYLKRKIELTEKIRIDLCTLITVIDVIAEFGLAEVIKIRGNDIIEIKLLPCREKINIDNSKILKSIKNFYC